MQTLSPVARPLSIEKLREQRQQEIEEARAIQMVMLPEKPLITGGVSIAHQFQPFTEVGGDFLDYFTLSDGTIGLYLGDVSGKGLPAALFAALVVGTLRGVHKTGVPPHAVLTQLNKRLLVRGVPKRHSAIQYAVLDPRTSVLQVTSAGMPGPLHLSPHECRVLELSGIPPGLLPDAAYESHSIRLSPGDTLVFFTDGLTDALDSREDPFGFERLQQDCSGAGHLPPSQLLFRIFDSVTRFSSDAPQHDDMTAAVLRYSP